MSDTKPIRWMISFWHSDGNSRDEADFPEVNFWHSNKYIARVEAARVLIELVEGRGDKRDWVAAGHPDPFEVGIGRHPGGQWVLRYEDLKQEDNAASKLSAEQRLSGMKSAAGSWRGLVDGEKLKRMLYEARRYGSNTGWEQ